MAAREPLLAVRALSVAFDGAPPVLDVVDLDVAAGEALALVGESGSGKSLLALAVAGLLPPGARTIGGEVRLEGRDLLALGARERRAMLGREIGIVFQDPRSALHPAYPVGWQVTEAVRRGGAGRREARRKAVELLGRMGIPSPERRAREHPHQLSGGMCQRAALAIALARDPRLLLADEPTTALDVSVQAGVLELLRGLRQERGLALLLITHDLAVVAGNADRVTVLYAGRVAEEASAAELFRRPAHPYTLGLLRSLPGPRGSELTPIPGTVPGPGERPPGCVFESRCFLAEPECRTARPAPPALDGRRSACHRSAEVPAWRPRDEP